MAVGTGTGDILPPTIGRGPRHGNHHGLIDGIRRHKRKAAVALGLTAAAVAGGVVAATSGNSSAAATPGEHLVLKSDPCGALLDTAGVAANKGVSVVNCSTDSYDPAVTLLHAKVDMDSAAWEINVLNRPAIARLTAKQLATMSAPLPADSAYGDFTQQAQLANFKNVTSDSVTVNGQSLPAYYESGLRTQTASTGDPQEMVEVGNDVLTVDLLSTSPNAKADCNTAAAVLIETLFASGDSPAAQ